MQQYDADIRDHIKRQELTNDVVTRKPRHGLSWCTAFGHELALGYGGVESIHMVGGTSRGEARSREQLGPDVIEHIFIGNAKNQIHGRVWRNNKI